MNVNKRRLLTYVFVLILTISECIWHRKTWWKRPEKLFATLALSCGLLFVLHQSTLTECSWDAAVHYQRVQQLTSAFEDSYSYVEVGHLASSPDSWRSHMLSQRYNTDALLAPLVDNTYKTREFYSYLAYLPAAFGTFVSRGLHLPLTTSFLLARLCNLLVYVGIIYAGLRKLRAGKLLVCFIALLPTVITLASNYSYDGWLNACFLFAFCYLVRFATDPVYQFSHKDFVLMLLLFLAGLGNKVIYAPMVLLALFVPQRIFTQTTRKSRIKYTATVLVVTVLPLLCYIYVNFGFGIFGNMSSLTTGETAVLSDWADDRAGSNVDPAAQVTYIMNHPAEYTVTLLSFLRYYVSYDCLADCTVRVGLNGRTNYQSLIFLLFAIVLLTGATEGYDRSSYRQLWYFRLLSLLAVFGTTCFVVTSMYLTFSKDGSDNINGVQARYLLPLVFPTLFAVSNARLKLPVKQEYYNAAILGIIGCILYATIWNMITVPYFVM